MGVLNIQRPKPTNQPRTNHIQIFLNFTAAKVFCIHAIFHCFHFRYTFFKCYLLLFFRLSFTAFSNFHQHNIFFLHSQYKLCLSQFTILQQIFAPATILFVSNFQHRILSFHILRQFSCYLLAFFLHFLQIACFVSLHFSLFATIINRACIFSAFYLNLLRCIIILLSLCSQL